LLKSCVTITLSLEAGISLQQFGTGTVRTEATCLL